MRDPGLLLVARGCAGGGALCLAAGTRVGLWHGHLLGAADAWDDGGGHGDPDGRRHHRGHGGMGEAAGWMARPQAGQ